MFKYLIVFMFISLSAMQSLTPPTTNIEAKRRRKDPLSLCEICDEEFTKLEWHRIAKHGATSDFHCPFPECGNNAAGRYFPSETDFVRHCATEKHEKNLREEKRKKRDKEQLSAATPAPTTIIATGIKDKETTKKPNKKARLSAAAATPAPTTILAPGIIAPTRILAPGIPIAKTKKIVPIIARTRILVPGIQIAKTKKIDGTESLQA